MNSKKHTVYVVTATESNSDGITTEVLGVFNSDLMAYGTASFAVLEWARDNNGTADADQMSARCKSKHCKWLVHEQRINC